MSNRLRLKPYSGELTIDTGYNAAEITCDPSVVILCLINHVMKETGCSSVFTYHSA